MRFLRVCLLLSGLLLLFAFKAQASDCSGGWIKMPNYRSGQGGPCKMMGLDSRAGTCLPGRQYETLCDDKKGGMYRTCEGPRRCSGSASAAPPSNYGGDCTGWDYKRNRPCPSGYVNNDCYGDCESLPAPGQQQWNQQRDCESWDYQRNRPCPPGYTNRDCRGGCE